MNFNGLFSSSFSPVRRMAIAFVALFAWLLLSASAIAATTTIAAKHSGKCLDIVGGPTAVANGAKADQWACSGQANQAWTLKDMGSGQYQLIASHSGRCLDVPAGGSANGLRLEQWDCAPGAKQLWTLQAEGAGYYKIISAASGKCVDVAGSQTVDGAAVQQWDCLNQDNQRWLLQVPATIDMIVTGISMSPATPVSGQPVTFSATIKNQGNTATPAGVKNGVVFSVDGTVISWSDNNTASIPAGGSVTVTANGGPSGASTWTATAGTHSIDAWVNDAARYPESNTANNHLVKSVTVAAGSIDMIVTASSMSPANPTVGQPVTFSATIKNQGTAPTPAGVKNGVVFSVDGAVVSWSDNNTASIPAGGSVTVTANGGPSGASAWTATAGSHNLDSWVNDAARYPESNTGNNHLANLFSVGAASGAIDMIVTGISMSPAAPASGQPVTFSATIKNQGTAATPAGIKNGVVFSVDGSVVSWSDNNTSSIPAGGTVTVTANGGPAGSATWLASGGTHTVDAWVNDANRYAESNTANNHLTSNITVSGGVSGPAGQDANLYNLVFNEEFDGTSLNAALWNNHMWYDSSNPTINYSVGGGSLRIWPQRDGNGNFFDRTLDTDGKYYQTYGFFEMEAKLPVGKGTWPAFWLLNHDDATARPEIDIMEAYAGGGPNSGWSDSNFHPTTYAGTTHWPETNSIKLSPSVDLSAAFHKYGAKWTANSVSYYFDGKLLGTVNVSMPARMYIMLDLWFGSASGTPDNSTPQGSTNSFEVRYVKAWQFK